VTASVLSISGLNVSFGKQPQSGDVVNDLSFDLAPGETLGLVGESGCGKSVTAAAILGILKRPPAVVTYRHILLDDLNLGNLDERAMRAVRGCRISMIFQDPLTALDPVFTIHQQLREVIDRHRFLDSRVASKLEYEILQRMEIADPARILKSYPHQLSGGMRQRVMIAMALVCRPRVLLADEPTTALDVITQASILRQMKDLAREFGTAIVLITHDIGVVANTCDRCMVMHKGRIVECAPVDELLGSPSHPYTASLLAAAPSIGETDNINIPGAER
jgi:ABC-type dipeptide/oligopeptide/nickel transport system ATPase component